MERILRIFMLAALPFMLFSCGTPAGGDDAVEVVLKMDKDQIAADGKDAVNFTVIRGSVDCTAEAQIIVNGKVIVGNKYTTSVPGTYLCSAVVDGIRSEEVSFEAMNMTVENSRFEKHVALWEFTGAWCTMCPSGYSTMNFILSRNETYSNTVHMMAFHSDSSGEDPMAIPQTDEIQSHFGIEALGFPSFMMDMYESGGLSDATEFRNALDDVFAGNTPHCGVAVSSAIAGGTAKVTVKVLSELAMTYRVAVFVVEDHVKGPQKDGMLSHAEYDHRHVVRRVVSSSFLGDRLATVAADEEVSKEYDIELDPEWNLDNTYVYALAVNSREFVNNMNCCLLDGGDSDYQLK